jgi:pimeloyl-ACP methyl ester carboxylesterase
MFFREVRVLTLLGWLLLPLWISVFLVGAGFILALWVFPGGSSRGPHDTHTRWLVGVIRALVFECLAMAWLIYTIPWRYFRRRPCPRSDSGQVPVVLLAGFMESPATMALLRHRLQKTLGRPVVALRPPPCTRDISFQTQLAGEQVLAVLSESGAQQVDLIGHSLGGILARCLAEDFPELTGRIRLVATLGSPHLGSAPARIVPLRSIRQTARGSAFLERLNALCPPAGVRYLGICSVHDNLVMPWNCALSPRGDNFILQNLGHVSLLLSAQVAEILRRELSPPPPAAAT